MPEVTDNEKQYLSVDNAHQVFKSPDTVMTDKLLYCLLETMKEMKEEITQLRKSNQHLEKILNSVLTQWEGRPVVQVYNSNV